MWRSLLVAAVFVATPATGQPVVRHLDGADLVIPSASPAAPHPVAFEDLMGLRDMKGLAVSPDGRHAATLLNQPDVAADSYRIAWFIVPIAGDGAARNVGDAGEPEFFSENYGIDRVRGHHLDLAAKWAPDSGSIAYLRRWNGEVQVWRSGLDGGQEQLTRNSADVVDFVWSGDGRQIIFATAAPRGALEAANERDGRDGFLVSAGTDWSFRHQQPFRSQFELTGGRPRIWVLDLSSGEERAASEAERRAYEQGLGPASGASAVRDFPAPRGGLVAQLALADPLKVRAEPPRKLTVARRDRPGAAPIICRDPACEGYFDRVLEPGGGPVQVWWRADGKALYFRRDNGLNRPGLALHEWVVGARAVRTILRTNDTLTDCNVLPGRLVCLRQTPVWPRTLVSIDLASGGFTTHFDPNPQWRDVQLGETSWLQWADKEGHETFGVLVKPLGYQKGRRYPLVLIGKNTDNAVRGDASARYPAHVLAASGFVTLVYDIWSDEADWNRPDALARRYADTVPTARVPFQQMDAVIDQLSREGLVDADRVGIAGHSDGLNTVAYGLINSERFKAASVGWIRWNPTNYYTTRNSYSDQLEAAGLLHPIDQPPSPLMRNLSLSLNVTRVQAPILVHASELEFIQQSQMEPLRRFEDVNKPLEMYVFPGEKHEVFHPAHRDAEFRRNVQWFKFWLQGEEAADPLDPQQYERWRRLRAQNEPKRSDRAKALAGPGTP